MQAGVRLACAAPPKRCAGRLTGRTSWGRSKRRKWHLTLVVTLTVDQLEELVGRAVRKNATVQEAEVLTRPDVAKLLQVHPNVVSRYVKRFGLPARQVGGEWRFLRAEVMAWIDSRKPVAAEGRAA